MLLPFLETIQLALGTIPDLITDDEADMRTSLADAILLGSGQKSGRVVYYVNGNRGSDDGTGLTWATAKKTLAAAVTLSNANIALDLGGWAARNVILCKGDTLLEDLTVLPSKCDVIGVGSHNANPMCTIEGVQTIGAGAYMGTRFINMRFFIKAAGGDLFTVPTTTSGLAFHRCVFDAHNTVKAGGAIIATASMGLKIMSCRFIGEYSDAVIELGAGQMDDCVIEGNTIEGVNKGIEVNSSLAMTQWQGFIKNNTFFTTLACIDDASSKFAIIGNRGVTLAAKGSSLAGAVVGNIALSLDNRFSCSDENNVEWPALGAI